MHVLGVGLICTALQPAELDLCLCGDQRQAFLLCQAVPLHHSKMLMPFAFTYDQLP
jgi:hypothetical protein